MTRMILIADTEAEIDALPAGDVERADLILVKDPRSPWGSSEGSIRVFKARHRPSRGTFYADLSMALENEGGYL